MYTEYCASCHSDSSIARATAHAGFCAFKFQPNHLEHVSSDGHQQYGWSEPLYWPTTPFACKRVAGNCRSKRACFPQLPLREDETLRSALEEQPLSGKLPLTTDYGELCLSPSQEGHFSWKHSTSFEADSVESAVPHLSIRTRPLSGHVSLHLPSPGR
ncbi:hypothetical protein VTG60DRAFT_6250 [Thermothelomyces hinnuleus]